MPLSDVTVLITSFLRHGYLTECLHRLKRTLPECSVVVVDDSDTAPDTLGFPCFTLPFDSGLSAKRNEGAKRVTTKYMLMGSDDFDFGTDEARRGVLKLAETLETFPQIDVAGGQFKRRPYEGFLEIGPGYIKERRLEPDGKQPYYQVDLTVNYYMVKPQLLAECPYDERMKIGGEHGDWFMTLKKAGKLVAWVPGVNINDLQDNQSGWQDGRYHDYRSRTDVGHKICLEKHGIKIWRGFNE